MISNNLIDSKEHLIVTREGKPNKTYIIDPNLIQTGQYKKCKKMAIQVQKNDETKEKIYFFKIFPSASTCKDEFDSHLKIHQLIEEKKDVLMDLGITPGTGIEQKPVCATYRSKHSFIIKKPYHETLHEAIKRGVFCGNSELLLKGAKQLLEGLLTFIEIGFLYTDIKTKNILFGRKDEMKLAFTDFEETPFSQDGKALFERGFRVAQFMIPQKEIYDLVLYGRNLPSEEILSKLHKIYSFNLGAVFFEMATKLSLVQFLFLKDFSKHLATNPCIEAFWKKGLELNCKNYLSLTSTLDDSYQNDFMIHCFSAPKGPSIHYMTEVEAQEAIIEEMEKSGAPKKFGELVASMVHMNPSKRIDIREVYPNVKP